MPLPLALPVALSAIQALIKFRGRLDTILALNETTTGLPFALPPVPTDDAPHVEPMLAFFQNATGRGILAIRGLETDWRLVEPAPFAGGAQAALGRLLRAYYEAADVLPRMLGPDAEANRRRAAKGPGAELRLAYYVVESDRLSRNPAVTRVLLAAADTLLEFGAAHAGLFTANPRTRAVLESLLTEFAVKQEWDDAGGAGVFRKLLGAAVAAALENPGALPDRPAVHALVGALAEVQAAHGADFAARLVTREGFQALVGRLLVRSADDPALLPGTPVLREALAAMLREAGTHLDGLLAQPGALAGVLEQGVAAATAAAVPLVDQKIAGQPLLAAALKATLGATQSAAAQHALFGAVADGAFVSTLYRAVLGSVAAQPAALASAAGLSTHAAALISALAGELARSPLTPALTRALAARALETLAAEPGWLGARGDFSAKLIGTALAAAAPAVRAGFTAADLAAIADDVVRAALAHPALAGLDDRLRPVVLALAQTLSAPDLARVATPAGRRALFAAALDALTANPEIWARLAEKKLAAPLAEAVLRALAADPTRLLSGPALTAALQQILEAAALRGLALLEARVVPAALGRVIESALAFAAAAAGAGIDARTLPAFLRRVIADFLAAPIDLADAAALAAWLKPRLSP